MSEINEPDVYEYHWFACNAYLRATSDSLFHALLRLMLATEPLYGTTLPISVWRVPGRDKDTHYDVVFYTPQAQGAEYVGTTVADEAWIMTGGGALKIQANDNEETT